ncbi:UNVERIFIED_CONTAM: Guanine nucleotide-binding protein G(o) subunit alpha [Siphonaria sp. JEL0065]|nr:Guanine nucleotide-binding protein G(o) subunit alpha [Siphonaria sp. JEL0065]
MKDLEIPYGFKVDDYREEAAAMVLLGAGGESSQWIGSLKTGLDSCSTKSLASSIATENRDISKTLDGGTAPRSQSSLHSVAVSTLASAIVSAKPKKRHPMARVARRIFQEKGDGREGDISKAADTVEQMRTGFGFMGDEEADEEELEAISFLNDLDRFFASDYLPTDQDILQCRLMTINVTETHFEVDGNQYRIFDVGGQRSERKRWAAYFDDVKAIIFVVAISTYDQVCSEDSETNRITEALNLFGSICNHPFFKATPLILFLNKQDIFEAKLEKGSKISEYFPDYTYPNDFEHASTYFLAKFREMNKYKKKSIYAYFTWATDITQSRTILNTVCVVVVQLSLSTIGFQ